MTHRIHLRAHWEVSEPSPGRVCFVRHFGRPRMPAGGLTIKLIISGIALPGTVRINSNPPIPIECDPFSFDSGDLASRNEMAVEFPGDSASLPPGVVMEIAEGDGD